MCIRDRDAQAAFGALLRYLFASHEHIDRERLRRTIEEVIACLLYTSDAADERSSVDLGGRRIIKKKNKTSNPSARCDIVSSTDPEHVS